MTHYNAIYLSPHLDDAVLSCGGQIFQRTQAGERVLIATVTAGSPASSSISTYAQSLHDRWVLVVDAVEARRQEDQWAAAVLGGETLLWPNPDCIYRHNPITGLPYYTSDEEIFGEVQSGEESLVMEIAQLVDQLPPHDQLFVPLGVGHHVDHLLTRSAAEKRSAENQGQLWYYEEYPYAQVPGATDLLIERSLEKWTAHVIPIGDETLQAHI